MKNISKKSDLLYHYDKRTKQVCNSIVVLCEGTITILKSRAVFKMVLCLFLVTEYKDMNFALLSESVTAVSHKMSIESIAVSLLTNLSELSTNEVQEGKTTTKLMRLRVPVFFCPSVSESV